MRNQHMPIDVMQGQGVEDYSDSEDDPWAYQKNNAATDDGKKPKRRKKKGGMAVMDFYGNQNDGYDDDGVYVARAAGG